MRSLAAAGCRLPMVAARTAGLMVAEVGASRRAPRQPHLALPVPLVMVAARTAALMVGVEVAGCHTAALHRPQAEVVEVDRRGGCLVPVLAEACMAPWVWPFWGEEGPAAAAVEAGDCRGCFRC